MLVQRLKMIENLETFLFFLQTAGAIRDILVGEQVVVQYLLTLINSSDKYKKWGNLSATDSLLERSTCSSLEKQKRGYPSDHTQV